MVEMARKHSTLGKNMSTARLDKSAPALRKPRARHVKQIQDGKERIEHADDPRLYLDRELSLLAFQRRVLEEAEDPLESAVGARQISLDSVFEFG